MVKHPVLRCTGQFLLQDGFNCFLNRLAFLADWYGVGYNDNFLIILDIPAVEDIVQNMAGCKTRDIMRNEVYFSVRRRSAPQQTVVFQQPATANRYAGAGRKRGSQEYACHASASADTHGADQPLPHKSHRSQLHFYPARESAAG